MVSVIIPIFNRAHYILECLNSVFQQTYKDFEIIIVDDGSTDNLKEVLMPYMNKIIYIYKENGGVSSARNEGIRQAKGDFIAWLDSDDKWFDFKFDLQIAVLKKIPQLGFVYSDFSCFSDKDGFIAKSYNQEYHFILKSCGLKFNNMFKNNGTLKTLGISVKDVHEETLVYWGDIKEKVFMGPMFLTSSVIINKKCIEEIGFFNEEYEIGEDFDFHARIAKKYPVAFVDLPTLAYRRFHPDQLSSKAMELKMNLAWLDVTKKLGIEDNDFYKKNKTFADFCLSRCYYGLGQAYLKANKLELALTNFWISIKRNPKQKKIYLLVFLTFLRLAKRFFFKIFFSKSSIQL